MARVVIGLSGGVDSSVAACLLKDVYKRQVLCTLEDLVRETAAVLTSRGRFYLVHRPFRLAEIMGMLMKYRLEPKRMRLVYPYVDKEPNKMCIRDRRLLWGTSSEKSW